jgi:uncharacterized protein
MLTNPAFGKISDTDQASDTPADSVPRRPLGKAGAQVSILGVGDYHLGSTKNQQEATELVAAAIGAGINFFDNAWEYHDGVSEEKLGITLKGKRQDAFVMTKVCTLGRGKEVAMQQLEESLRLQTDHLDLWQIHEVVYYNDPDLIPFDTVQMPLNCLDTTFRSFETQVLPVATRKGLGVLGMKSLGGSGELVTNGAVTAREGLSYAISLPVSTTISGMESLAVLQQNLKIASGFKPLSAAAMQATRERVRTFAADGRYELFKTTTKYDGKVGREQHHFPR